MLLPNCWSYRFLEWWQQAFDSIETPSPALLQKHSSKPLKFNQNPQNPHQNHVLDTLPGLQICCLLEKTYCYHSPWRAVCGCTARLLPYSVLFRAKFRKFCLNEKSSLLIFQKSRRALKIVTAKWSFLFKEFSETKNTAVLFSTFWIRGT